MSSVCLTPTSAADTRATVAVAAAAVDVHDDMKNGADAAGTDAAADDDEDEDSDRDIRLSTRSLDGGCQTAVRPTSKP